MPRISLPSIRLPELRIIGVVGTVSAALLIGALATFSNDPTSAPSASSVPETAPNTVVVTSPPSTTVAPTTVAPTTTTTTIVPAITDPALPCQQWVPLALEVGWPNDPEVLTMLLRVMNRESRCRPEVRSASSDTGLLQVNDFWCEPSKYNTHPAGWLGANGIVSSCADLAQPEVNLTAGLAIWLYSLERNGNGWHPWRYSGPIE